jgi:hypothetical protein
VRLSKVKAAETCRLVIASGAKQSSDRDACSLGSQRHGSPISFARSCANRLISATLEEARGGQSKSSGPRRRTCGVAATGPTSSVCTAGCVRAFPRYGELTDLQSVKFGPGASNRNSPSSFVGACDPMAWREGPPGAMENSRRSLSAGTMRTRQAASFTGGRAGGFSGAFSIAARACHRRARRQSRAAPRSFARQTNTDAKGRAGEARPPRRGGANSDGHATG